MNANGLEKILPQILGFQGIPFVPNDHPQCIIFDNNYFDWKVILYRSSKFTHQHRQSSVTHKCNKLLFRKSNLRRSRYKKFNFIFNLDDIISTDFGEGLCTHYFETSFLSTVNLFMLFPLLSLQLAQPEQVFTSCIDTATLLSYLIPMCRFRTHQRTQKSSKVVRLSINIPCSMKR